MRDLPHKAIAITCFGLAALLGVLWFLFSIPADTSPQSIVPPCTPQRLPAASDTLAPGAYCFELSDDKARLSFRVDQSFVDMDPMPMPLRVYLYDGGTNPRRTFDIPEKRCTSLGFGNVSRSQYGAPSVPPPGYSKVEARAGSRTFIKVRVRRVGDDSAYCRF